MFYRLGLLTTITVVVVAAAFAWEFRASNDFAQADAAPGEVRVLLLTGISNGAHDWEATTQRLQQALAGAAHVDVVRDPEHRILTTSDLKHYDVLLLNFTRVKRWSAEAERGFQEFLESGKGVVAVHAANNSFSDWPDYERTLGAAWRSGTFHPPYGPFLVHASQPNHPIMNGVERFETVDEMYCNLREHPEQMNVLAYAMGPDRRQSSRLIPQPMIWTTSPGNGRVFHTVLGHDAKAMCNPYFVEIVRRGTLWAAGKLPGEDTRHASLN